MSGEVFRDPQLQRLGPVDIHPERGIVEGLGYAHIDHSRDGSDLGQQLDGELVGRIRVPALELDIDRRRQTEVEYLTCDVRGLRIDLHARQLFVYRAPDLLDVPDARMMFL